MYSEKNAWKSELRLLGEILKSTGLEETTKWGGPVFVSEGKNIVGIGAFKSYFGLWFYQGALLRDKQKKLINAQEGVTKALRQWRFQSAEEIDANLIKAYVAEAIELAKSGKSIKPDRNKPLEIPTELTKALSKNKAAKASFEKLSLSKRRDYAEYISKAKQEATKLRRLEKVLPMIEAGLGLNDKYM
jgi:uncharacterized protein YdeI (YjbR/CyaY-like superfamily)